MYNFITIREGGCPRDFDAYRECSKLVHVSAIIPGTLFFKKIIIMGLVLQMSRFPHFLN
jgi:hypothetical protein